MHLLWVSHFLPFPPSGGALQRSYHLLRHAASRHTVDLLALHQPRLLPGRSGQQEAVEALSSLCASVRVFSMPSERSAFWRVATKVRSLWSALPHETHWLASTEFSTSIRAWCERHPEGLVHVDTVGAWPRLPGISNAIVLNHHNVESMLMDRRSRLSSPVFAPLVRREARKIRALERRVAPQAAMNLVVSDHDAEQLRTIAPSARIAVVENGVDTSYWTPGPARTEGAVCFAGTLGWFPNADAVSFLVGEIWPLLAAQQPESRLLIIGRDPPPVAVRAASSRVTVTGFVPDVRPFLQDASIYVCPIRVGGGTRLKVLDALAMALPIVSTTIGVEGLQLNEGEHFLRADTAVEFVGQIIRLQSDPALRDRLGRAGRHLVEDRYDWSVIGRQLDKAYHHARQASYSVA